MNTYWRTRTIHEAMQQGYSGCAADVFGLWTGCGHSLEAAKLLRRRRIAVDRFMGNVPLQYEKCGTREPLIREYQ
jgi:hypothetical protein